MSDKNSSSLEINVSRQFTRWLDGVGGSLAFTTYQGGKVFLLGLKPDGSLMVTERTLERPMGLAVSGNSLYISTAYQIWRFENAMPADQRDSAGFDAVYAPQMSWVTGDVDGHDMIVTPDGPVFANTLFSCLARPHERYSFDLVWQPPFISRLAAEDRCHLNGLAADEGGNPAFVTMVSESDVGDGWRDRRTDGGLIMDVRTNEVVMRGLSMPHSPRVHGDALYFLNSGTGHLCKIALENGVVPDGAEYEQLTFFPGYARGMKIVGDYAVVGLSKPRGNKTFEGLPLDDALTSKSAEPRCGLVVVNLKTGDMEHGVRLDGFVTELFDVEFIAGVKTPQLIGFKNDDVRRVISLSAE